jgi:tripartite-type tricarboxylate transporter receptor subunit TctC
MITRRILARAVAAAPLAALAGEGRAQDSNYPSKIIQLVVGFPAGQSSDIGARVLTKQMAEVLNQQIYVDNKPGASGIVGHEYVKNAKPDGYTILFGSTGTLAINPTLFRKLPYDPIKDFAAVAMLYQTPMFLVAAPTLPFNTFREAVAYVKANPGKTTYGSGGSGSTQHIAMQMLNKQMGMDCMHVPYKGTPGMVTDLMAGRVDFTIEPGTSIMPYIQAKSVKVLGTTVAKRLPFLPDIPTVAEQGAPGFEAMTWGALLAPAGTPAPVVAKLNAAANQALGSKEMAEHFGRTYAQPMPGTPAELEAFLKKEIAKWGKAVEESGAQVD